MVSETDIAPYVEKFEEFYSAALQDKISRLLSEYPVQKSLMVDYEELEKYDREAADLLVKQPDTMIHAAEQALVAAQEVSYKTAHPDEKFEPHVRFYNLPDPGLLIQDISSRQIRELISFKGVITKRGPVRHKVKVAVYKCQMCDAKMKVPLSKNTEVPQVCTECKRRALKLEEEDSYFVDVQNAESQELLERLKGGAPAATIALWLEDDLVNGVTPGETVAITGVMRLRPPEKGKAKESSQIYTRYIDVVSAQKTQREFEEIETTADDEQQIRELSSDPRLYDRVREAIAPGIYGHSEVKEALTLQLFGGTPGKSMPGGAPIRDDIHILLIGDPGAAKTRFLQYIQNLAPKGIYVSGKSVTGVGLTAAAEKDEMGEGGWTLKAGALVIASGGIAGVDEFDKIDEVERAAMHEVMESQSYHPSTRLLLANGNEVPIGDFVEKLMSENSGKIKEGKDCLILGGSGGSLDGMKVLTTDFRRIYPVQISQVSKHKAPGYFIKVTLQNGRELLVTPEHPFWTMCDGNISTKPAVQLKEGDFTTVPSRLPLEASAAPASAVAEPSGAVADPMLFKFLGYHISDGSYELNRGRKNGINFSNKDEQVLQDYASATSHVFSASCAVSTDRRTGVMAARLVSMPIVEKLRALGPSLMEKGVCKSLPQELMGAPDQCAREFLRAIFEGDGSISHGGTLSLVCENIELAHQVQTLLLRFGIGAHLLRDGTVFRVYATGEKNLALFSSLVGFVSDRKQNAIRACLARKQLGAKRRRWAYSDSIPGCCGVLVRLSASLKLTQKETFGHAFDWTQPAISRPLFERAVGAIRQRLERIQELCAAIDSMPMEALASARRELRIAHEDIGGSRFRSHVGYWERNATHKVRQETITLTCVPECAASHLVTMEARYKALFRECCERMLACEQTLRRLEQILESDVSFCRIKKVERLKNDGIGWVYDVGAGPTQAFVSECAVLHNTVSVAKAGIVARFKAKTAILAAANPKFGRFDPNKLPGMQFDIPPTILSRFDLIFPIIDVLDETKDSALAQHLLNIHQKGASATEAEKTSEMDPAFLRKYVSYARQHVKPLLSVQASDRIKEFYVEIRKRGKAEGAVPITPRQIEGLVRMAEASAKIRLSDSVAIEDAERAIRLTNYVLDKVSRDRETGRIDADIIATGRPKSQVDKITGILSIVQRMQDQLGAAEIARVVEQAVSENIDEITARRIVDDLIYKGELYKVKPGFVKLVEQQSG